MRLLILITIALFACVSEDTPEMTPLLVVDAELNGPDTTTYSTDMLVDMEIDVGPPILDLTAMGTASCLPFTPYEGVRSIFTDNTNAWGLAELGVRGTRLSVGDINGDGLPDLAARRAGTRLDEFYENEEQDRRFHWLLKNQGGRFEDVTLSSGFNAVRGSYPRTIGRPAEVVAFADIDNDGDLDIYTGVDTRQALSIELSMDDMLPIEERSEVLINDGTGQFTLGPVNHVLRRLNRQDVPSGVSFVDVNLDGNIDVWIAQGGLGAPMQDRLYLGTGDGAFEDVTRDVNLRTENWVDPEAMNEGRAHSTAWSATACDLNRDGYSELLVGSYGRAPNHLWRAAPSNDGLSFVNESVASGYAYDNDQTWTDNQFAACFCRSNPSATECSLAESPRIQCNQMNWRHDTDREPFRLGGNSGTTVCADFDNDGWPDLVTTEIRHWWAGAGSDRAELLLNQQDNLVRFIRPGNDNTGLAIEHSGANWDEGIITATWLDFDNDGRKDLYLGGTDYNNNRGYLFHNQSEPGMPRFVRLDPGVSIDQHRSHGVVAADFDRDGDIDLVIGHSRNRCDAADPTNCYESRQVRLFENTLADAGNWLQLKLEGGPTANRDAVGAQIDVTSALGTQHFEIKGGYGHYGAQDDHIVHIGLGEDCDAVVTVTWPNAARDQTRYRFPANHRFRVTPTSDPQLAPNPQPSPASE